MKTPMIPLRLNRQELQTLIALMGAATMEDVKKNLENDFGEETAEEIVPSDEEALILQIMAGTDITNELYARLRKSLEVLEQDIDE